jgi:GxxExxY protein
MFRTFSRLDDATEACMSEVIDSGLMVHKAVGPGYMETPYMNAMCLELRARSIPFECEQVFTVSYRDRPVGIHRLDLVVRGCVVVELKAVRVLEPIHQAQLMSYLKASKIRAGLLMNFGCATFKEGVKRIVL